MFRIVNGNEIYNEVDGKGVPVNVSAKRNDFTGEVISYSVTAAGEPVELPATSDIATINEVVARFACAEGGYKFPSARAAAEPTVAELKAKAIELGIEVPAKASKAKLQELIAAKEAE